MSEGRRALPDNYRWWRRNGKRWREEIERRRSYMPVYHLQELFLADYVRRCGPLRVLEFGFGFGRHLEYLKDVEGVEIYGFEQSRSMANQLDWASKKWKDRHIVVGDPFEDLPFEDDFFDLVFSVSVLIHMVAADVSRVLGELLRVSSWQILHIENNVTTEERLTSEVHNGCWDHDLESLYKSAGYAIEVLPKHFVVEDLYRVVKEPRGALPVVDPLRAQICFRLDEAISGGIAEREAQKLRGERTGESLRKQKAKLSSELDRARSEVGELQKRARLAESDLEPLRVRATEAENELEPLRTRATEAENELEPLRVRATEAENEAAARLERARLAESKLSVAIEKVESLKRDMSDWLGRFEKVEMHLEQERKVRTQSEDVSAALQLELEAAQRRLASLRGAIVSALRW